MRSWRRKHLAPSGARLATVLTKWLDLWCFPRWILESGLCFKTWAPTLCPWPALSTECPCQKFTLLPAKVPCKISSLYIVDQYLECVSMSPPWLMCLSFLVLAEWRWRIWIWLSRWWPICRMTCWRDSIFANQPVPFLISNHPTPTHRRLPASH